MKTVFALSLAVLLASCASLGESLGPGAAARDQLWRQGHAAMNADSFRVAIAAFQRLAADHPETMEGREALFYIGTMYLDPSHPGFDAAQAHHNLTLYTARDTVGDGAPVIRRPEAHRLLELSRELTIPCEQRDGPLRCDPDEIVRRVTVPVPVPGDTVRVRPTTGDGAEVARLQRQVAERDATIRQLREELARIRETLAPRP
jgi:hypothetical protein